MTARADELRDDFDRGFAAALRPAETGHSDALCVRIGGEPFAIRLADVASLHARLRVVALPTGARELMGAAAIRASIVPVYDLAVALGMPRINEAPWIVLHRGGAAGFAFEVYEGHARVPERSTGGAAGGHVVGQLTVDGHPRSVIDLSSVLASIEKRSNQSGSAKEQ
jgi:purine-binding chemotaxis protein CheW